MVILPIIISFDGLSLIVLSTGGLDSVCKTAFGDGIVAVTFTVVVVCMDFNFFFLWSFSLFLFEGGGGSDALLMKKFPQLKIELLLENRL